MQNVTSLMHVLCCPKTKKALELHDGYLKSQNGNYPIVNNIPLFETQEIDTNAQIQQQHYTKVADAYARNLQYPHTKAYMSYLDDVFREMVLTEPLGLVAELCCGTGETFKILPEIQNGVGIDIAPTMLSKAIQGTNNKNIIFLQANALKLPFVDESFDTVSMLGGIHHIPDRNALFKEVARILKPGGRFIFREPLNDFWLWRALRFLIYKASPFLDDKTERPLKTIETIPLLQQCGLQKISWQPAGFFGFCLFMNSDILIFNRVFQYIPCISAFVKKVALLDRVLLKFHLVRNAGLQIIGVFEKKAK